MSAAEQFTRTAPLGHDVKVIAAETSGLIALCKPVGRLSHPNQPSEESRSLLNAPYSLARECYQWQDEWGGVRRAWLLNRLDSATSGIVLLATTAGLARRIRILFRHRRIQKIYAALVFGRPLRPQEQWHDHLAVQKKGRRVRSGLQGHIPSASLMHLVDINDRCLPPVSLIQLNLSTGRSHQLRVQCAHRRLPIVGDATYGDFKMNRAFARTFAEKRLFLHSFRTSFHYEWAGENHRFVAEASLPHAFTAALTSSGGEPRSET